MCDIPARTVIAGLEAGGVEDTGTFDGLPSTAHLARAALEIDPAAVLRGLLLDNDREDARLHLDTIYVSGDLARHELRAHILRLFERGERPSAVTRAPDGSLWELWWD